MDFVLVLLQPNQPPATNAHGEYNNQASKHTSNNRRSPSPATDGDANTRSSGSHEHDCKYEVGAPGNVAEMAAEYWKQSENFDGEEGNGEDVSCGGQT
jgi:hypothetical protein